MVILNPIDSIRGRYHLQPSRFMLPPLKLRSSSDEASPFFGSFRAFFVVIKKCTLNFEGGCETQLITIEFHWFLGARVVSMALESVEEFYDFVRYSRGLHTRIRNPSKKKTGPPKKNTSLPLLEKQHHRLQGAAATACAPRSYRITGNHLGMNTFHGPPKPTFLEVFMVNNLVFRWPKPVFFMVLGAHGFVVPPPNPKKTGKFVGVI